MRIFTSLLLVLLTSICHAQIKVIQVVPPKRYAISTNLIFIVDASSTINNYGENRAKFNKGWNTIVGKFGGDQLFFRTYVFHKQGQEKRGKWINAGGPQGLEEFIKAKKWIAGNTGTYSWGLKSIRMAMRDKNPLDKNPATNTRLTIILLTDGGFSEASDYNGGPSQKQILEAPLDKHIYGRTGSFHVMTKTIEAEQKLRVLRGDAKASIVTIGIENIVADKRYGTEVKRPDNECQAWLKMIGRKYGGGYFVVKKISKKHRNKKVS